MRFYDHILLLQRMFNRINLGLELSQTELEFD